MFKIDKVKENYIVLNNGLQRKKIMVYMKSCYISKLSFKSCWFKSSKQVNSIYILEKNIIIKLNI
jgi:hypothetical protein